MARIRPLNPVCRERFARYATRETILLTKERRNEGRKRRKIVKMEKELNIFNVGVLKRKDWITAVPVHQ